VSILSGTDAERSRSGSAVEGRSPAHNMISDKALAFSGQFFVILYIPGGRQTTSSLCGQDSPHDRLSYHLRGVCTHYAHVNLFPPG